jgi:glutaconate CoA-transferase subunit A
MPDSSLLTDVDELAAQVPNGAKIAIVKDEYGAPMTLVRALIRRGVRDLHLLTVPTGGFAAELLIGAGCVAMIETSGVSLNEFGAAPRFVEAVKSGRLAILDATCPAIYSALQAGEKGIPFMPIRGVLGADLAARRDDWKVINNPYAEGPEGQNTPDPLLLVAAIRPDFSLIHALKADRHGNVWIGREHGLATMAHAAHRTLVTVEEVVDEDFLAADVVAAGTIPAFYLSAIAEVKGGAWPAGLADGRDRDEAHLSAYARDARSDEGFARYLETHVMNAADRRVA